MPRGLRKKTKQYVLDQFQDEDPEAFFQYKSKSAHGLSHQQVEFLQAVECPSAQKVKVMLGRGVDPNFWVARSGQTPLHVAVENRGGRESSTDQMVGVMLFFGADPNAQDKQGRTPLHAACVGGRGGVVEMLLQAGADVCVEDERLETPLLVACSHLSPDSAHIVHLLLEAGGSVGVHNLLGQTALHLLSGPDSSRNSVMDAVRAKVGQMLLSHGMCASLVDDRGISPLTQEVFSMRELPMCVSGPGLAAVLLCGGASLDLQLMSSSDTCVIMALTHLLRDLHPLMSRSALRSYLQQVRASGAGGRRCGAARSLLHSQLQSGLTRVSSLAQMCRVCVRSALGGRVFPSVAELPVPDKMKVYLRGGD